MMKGYDKRTYSSCHRRGEQKYVWKSPAITKHIKALAGRTKVHTCTSTEWRNNHINVEQ